MPVLQQPSSINGSGIAPVAPLPLRVCLSPDGIEPPNPQSSSTSPLRNLGHHVCHAISPDVSPHGPHDAAGAGTFLLLPAVHCVRDTNVVVSLQKEEQAGM